MISVSGARGIAGASMTGEVASRYATSFAAMLGTDLGCPPHLCLARDTRPSGGDLSAAVSGSLVQLGCRVTVVPGTATTDEVLSHEPDGVFLSNGPGDPRPLDYAIETIRGLLGQKPIFGICLGHQLLGLALGGDIYKLKFGHRGANQPVLNRDTGRVEITTQNHGFAIEAESLGEEIEVTHVNLNDQTVEGIRSRSLGAIGVQYHPEASAGPHDSHYLFGDFRKMLLS